MGAIAVNPMGLQPFPKSSNFSVFTSSLPAEHSITFPFGCLMARRKFRMYVEQVLTVPSSRNSTSAAGSENISLPIQWELHDNFQVSIPLDKENR